MSHHHGSSNMTAMDFGDDGGGGGGLGGGGELKLDVDVHGIASKFSQELHSDIYNKLRDPAMRFNLRIDIEAASFDLSNVGSFIQLEILKHLHQLSLLTPPYLVTFGIIYCFLILFGVLFNVLIIFAFMRTQKLRTFRNVYVINLAISDLLLCTACAPLTILKYTYINWPLSRFWCKFGPSFQTVNTLVCAFSLATIAIDRWIFILHTGKDKTNKLLLYGSIVMIWLLAIVISWPIYWVTEVREFYFKETDEFMFRTCDEMWPDWPMPHHHETSSSHTIGGGGGFNYIRNVYLMMIFLLQYIIPVVLVTLTNLKICHFLTNMPTFYPQTDAFSTLRANSIRMSKIRRTTAGATGGRGAVTEEVIEEEKLRPNNKVNGNSNQNFDGESTTQPEGELHSAGGLIDTVGGGATITKMDNQKSKNEAACFVSTTNGGGPPGVDGGSSSVIVRNKKEPAAAKKQRFSRSKKILLFVCLSFTICWLPLLILNFFNDFFNHTYNVSWRELAPLFLASHLVAILSTSINPILYGLLNKNFFNELTRIGSSLLPFLFTAARQGESGVFAASPSEKNASTVRRNETATNTPKNKKSNCRQKSSNNNNKHSAKNNSNDKKVDETALSTNNIL